VPDGRAADLKQTDISKPRGWSISVGGDGQDSIWDVVIDDSENLIVLGMLTDKVTFEGVKGDITLSGNGGRTFVAKLDPKTRKWLWAEVLDVVPANLESPLIGYMSAAKDALGVDASGSIYVSGRFAGSATIGATKLTSAGKRDIYVVKLDPDGKVKWAVRAGGSGDDGALDLAVGDDGKITIGGLFSGTATFGSHDRTAKGKNDIFVARLDPLYGSFEWVARAGSDSTTDYEYAEAVVVDDSGSSTITGRAGGGAKFDEAAKPDGDSSAYVAGLDPAGTFKWVGGIDATRCASIACDPSGVIYLSCALLLPDSFFMLVKGREGTPSPQYPTIKAWKKIWHKTVFAEGAWASRLIVDGKGNSVVAGSYNGTLQLGPDTLPPGTYSQAFLARFAEKEIKGGEKIGATLSMAMGLARDKTGGLYVVGKFTGTGDFGGNTLKSVASTLEPGFATDGFIWYTGRGLE
jgi:hypothetical protein